VLCNFVYHKRFHETTRQFRAKCTHASVLRPVIDYLLKAVGTDGQVAFGNAPLQSCQWDRVIEETGASELLAFYRDVNARVRAVDLRLYSTQRSAIGVTSSERRNECEDGVSFDMGPASLLSALPDGAHFRVNDYDPRETERYHRDGHHVYLINRQALEADVLFSVPKLKTHEKVGLTACLKGFVGTVGLKQCLAHHRAGDAGSNGDERPVESFISRKLSYLNELAPTLPVGCVKRTGVELVERMSRRVLRRLVPSAGAWRGNDTAWRMTLDLAAILTHGTVDGRLAAKPVRTHLAVVDGVIGGEGQGPLSPDPVDSRCILYSDDVILADWACATIAGLDPGTIPLLRHALIGRFGTDAPEAACADAYVARDGRNGGWSEIPNCCVRPFRLPRGW
jgi:hypothetical protein